MIFFFSFSEIIVQKGNYSSLEKRQEAKGADVDMTLRIGINTRLARSFIQSTKIVKRIEGVCVFACAGMMSLFAWRYSAYTVATSCPNMALKADFTIKHCSFHVLRDRYCSNGPNCNITHRSSHKHWVSHAAAIRYV